jgi:hypothetical protein
MIKILINKWYKRPNFREEEKYLNVVQSANLAEKFDRIVLSYVLQLFPVIVKKLSSGVCFSY